MARRSSSRLVSARPHGEPSTRFRFDPRGTRFRIYQQASSVEGFAAPLTVHVASRPGTIGPGPSDSRIRVIDPMERRPYKWKLPYSDSAVGEPRASALSARRPASPAGQGRRRHFDHVRVGTRAFSPPTRSRPSGACSRSGSTTSGHRIVWFFRDREHRHLELIPRAETDNAWSGEELLEFGYSLPRRRGRRRSAPAWLCENFDVVAHETRPPDPQIHHR